jgi:hypothetical protein
MIQDYALHFAATRGGRKGANPGAAHGICLPHHPSARTTIYGTVTLIDVVAYSDVLVSIPLMV